jgi:hypothetical protein
MRRRLARALAAVFTLWFAIAMVEPAVLHACPVHDVASVPAGANGHSHVGHDAAPAHPTSSSHCLCLGDCATIAGVALPSPVTRLMAANVVEARNTGLPDHAYVPVAVAHAIPFANGPPTV